MDKPFFSIFIPTSTRPEYVQDCIASVLKQTFQSFEILISDNGTTKLCKEVVERFHDERIIYKRPSFPLGPCDNHDLAQYGFRGDYFILLGDKHRLTHTALEKVYEATQEYNNHIISFAGEVFTALEGTNSTELSKGFISRKNYTHTIKIIDTWDLIEEKMKFEDPFGFEKGLIYGNAFYSRELAEKIIKTNGNGRLFDGAIADRYTSFVAMGLEKSICFIDEPLSYYIRNGIHTSDLGKNSISALENVWKNSNKNYNPNTMENFLPLRECFALIKNIQAGDYFYAIHKLKNSPWCINEIKKKLDSVELNKVNYIFGVKEELRSVYRLDERYSVYDNEIQNYFTKLSLKEKNIMEQKMKRAKTIRLRSYILTKVISAISCILLNRKSSNWTYTILNHLDTRHTYINNFIEYL